MMLANSNKGKWRRRFGLVNSPNNQPVRKAKTANQSDCGEGRTGREPRNMSRAPRDITSLLPTNHIGKKKIYIWLELLEVLPKSRILIADLTINTKFSLLAVRSCAWILFQYLANCSSIATWKRLKKHRLC